MGEEILNLEERLGYVHKGMKNVLKLFPGRMGYGLRGGYPATQP
jgi:hypothetical protein